MTRVLPLPLIPLAILLLLASSCMNMSTLQTARVLPPGDQMVVIGGGLTKLIPEQAIGDFKIPSLPYLEGAFRIGVINGLDVGAHVSIPGTSGIDGKYQFLDKGGLAMATGLSLAGLQITSGDSKTNIADVTVPIYISYDVGSHFTPYIVPKYALRYIGGSSGSTVDHLIGGSGGIKIGDSIGVFLESTLMRDVVADLNYLQFNVAIFWLR